MEEAVDFSAKRPGACPKASGPEDVVTSTSAQSGPVTSDMNAERSTQVSSTVNAQPRVHQNVPAPWIHPFSYLLKAAGIFPPSVIADPMTNAQLVGNRAFGQNVRTVSSSVELPTLLGRRRHHSTSPGPNEPPRSASDDQSLKRSSTDDEAKDDVYWERRRRNNEAAKRSRDARRAKEEEIAIRAALLEQENLQLKAQVAVLKNETQKLHCLLFSHVKTTL